MSDTATFAVPAVFRSTERTVPVELPRRHALFTSLADVEVRLDELAATGHECQLIVLGPGVFALEWQ